MQSHWILTTIRTDNAQDVALSETSPREGTTDIANGSEKFTVGVLPAGLSIDLKSRQKELRRLRN